MQVVLVASSSYRTPNQVYRQGKVAIVSDKEGRRLLATGLFDEVVERAPAVVPASGGESEPTPPGERPLDKYKADELRELAGSYGLPTEGLNKAKLIEAILLFREAQDISDEPSQGSDGSAATEGTDDAGDSTGTDPE